MAYVDIVTALALLQFVYFGIQVGRARGRFGVKAPAITGNEQFERYFRVQQNTLGADRGIRCPASISSAAISIRSGRRVSG